MQTKFGLELTLEEIATLSNSLNEVCHGPEAIEDWEFETRMGCTKAEAVTLLEKMSDFHERFSVKL